MTNFYKLLLPVFSNLVFICCKDSFRFASHYANHMVLQRDPYAAVVWGFGEENALVTVSIAGRMIQTSTKKDWRGLDIWLVQLKFSFGGPYKITATSIVGNQIVSISLQDVYFGDVWLCGGQSNMAFTTNMSLHGTEEIDHASAYHQIRLFTVARYASEKPVVELEDESILQQWAVASKESVGGVDWSYFSALCWMFGRRLYEQYGIPIGLISSNYGGTRVEAWSSPETISRCNSSLHKFKPATSDNDYYYKNNQSGIDPNQNSVLWNAMIYPLLNTTIYGTIWYQGESNAVYRADMYNCTFPAMINGWRKEWFSGTYRATNLSFPFGFVQLAPVCFAAGDFPIIRWKQTAEYGYVPNTKQPDVFMAIAMDLPDQNSPYECIHPRDKTDVADRLFLAARAIAYGENVNWTGPIMDSASVQNSKITITVTPGQQIEVRSFEGFEIEYSNGTWASVSVMYWTFTGVTLSVNSVEDVRRVRYAWKDTPCEFKKCAIYAKGTDLPSGPFILSL